MVEAIEIMRRRRGGDDRLLAYKDGRSWRRPAPTWSTTTCARPTGLEATAKDFRTWHATVLAAAALAETAEPGDTKASRKRAVAGAMKEVAEFLGNTPALARSSYVDPRVVDAYEQGRTIERATRRTLRHHRRAPGGAERADARELLRESRAWRSPSSRATSPQQDVDAVVNAANSAMRGGGGVDGAIHRAGGPAMLEDCIAGSPTASPPATPAGRPPANLPARWVIHVVGPNHAAGQTDRSLLTSCYARALEVADELGARTVAFPLVSAGVYGWPNDDAINAALETLRSTPTNVEEARMVAFDVATYDAINQRLSTTQSMQPVSASTSEGSIAGYIAIRSWLRPSLR